MGSSAWRRVPWCAVAPRRPRWGMVGHVEGEDLLGPFLYDPPALRGAAACCDDVQAGSRHRAHGDDAYAE